MSWFCCDCRICFIIVSFISSAASSDCSLRSCSTDIFDWDISSGGDTSPAAAAAAVAQSPPGVGEGNTCTHKWKTESNTKAHNRQEMATTHPATERLATKRGSILGVESEPIPLLQQEWLKKRVSRCLQQSKFPKWPTFSSKTCFPELSSMVKVRRKTIAFSAPIWSIAWLIPASSLFLSVAQYWKHTCRW